MKYSLFLNFAIKVLANNVVQLKKVVFHYYIKIDNITFGYQQIVNIPTFYPPIPWWNWIDFKFRKKKV